MKITPILTEKSMNEAKHGHYSFMIENDMNKMDAKRKIESVFGVHVTGIRTINIRGGKKKNFRGQIKTTKDVKKAIVTLKGDEKIDVFEEPKKS